VSERIRFDTGDIFLLPTDGAVELGEERDAEAGLEILTQTLRKFNTHPLAEILEILRSVISRQGAQQDDRTVLLVRALSGSEQPALRQQLNDAACRDLFEAKWNRMLAGLAAGLADD
jgi:hypothetical protein